VQTDFVLFAFDCELVFEHVLQRHQVEVPALLHNYFTHPSDNFLVVSVIPHFFCVQFRNVNLTETFDILFYPHGLLHEAELQALGEDDKKEHASNVSFCKCFSSAQNFACVLVDPQKEELDANGECGECDVPAYRKPVDGTVFASKTAGNARQCQRIEKTGADDGALRDVGVDEDRLDGQEQFGRATPERLDSGGGHVFV